MKTPPDEGRTESDLTSEAALDILQSVIDRAKEQGRLDVVLAAASAQAWLVGLLGPEEQKEE